MHSLSGEVRSIRRKVFTKLGTYSQEKGTHWMYGSYAMASVLFGTHAFLVLYLSSSHPLMSGGPDSRTDYYLTFSGSTGGVLDTDRMFSRLTNNGCPQDQTDDIHLLGDNKTWLPYLLSQVQKRSSNVRRMFCQLFMHCTFILPGTCPFLVWWCPLTDRSLSCTCPVIMQSLCVLCDPYTDCKSLEQQWGWLSSPDNLLPQFFYPFLSMWRPFTLSGKVALHETLSDYIVKQPKLDLICENVISN